VLGVNAIFQVDKFANQVFGNLCRHPFVTTVLALLTSTEEVNRFVPYPIVNMLAMRLAESPRNPKLNGNGFNYGYVFAVGAPFPSSALRVSQIFPPYASQANACYVCGHDLPTTSIMTAGQIERKCPEPDTPTQPQQDHI
jgi:hypothetical protein